MGQCGPINPCPGCREMYLKDERYVVDTEHPNAFRIATDEDRRKRQVRRRPSVTALGSQARLPEAQSRRQAKARRSAKRRRRS